MRSRKLKKIGFGIMVLLGIKNDNIKYTQNEIFEDFEIKDIRESDKIGLEQIQEL